MTPWKCKSWFGLLMIALMMMAAANVAQASVLSVNVMNTDDVVTGEVIINDTITFRLHVLKSDSMPVTAFPASGGLLIRPDIADGMFVLHIRH